jgi:uncharacterized protein YcgI (DUF1989 family)
VIEEVTTKSTPTLERFHMNRKLTKHIVPTSHGHAFVIIKGIRFHIVGIHGEQVIDFMAWVASTLQSSTRLKQEANASPPALLLEKLCVAYTRYHLHGVTPIVNEVCSNAGRSLLRVCGDTIKVHHTTLMACFPQIYEKQRLYGHRSCTQNISEVKKEHGMRYALEMLEPFNHF